MAYAELVPNNLLQTFLNYENQEYSRFHERKLNHICDGITTAVSLAAITTHSFSRTHTYTIDYCVQSISPYSILDSDPFNYWDFLLLNFLFFYPQKSYALRSLSHTTHKCGHLCIRCGFFHFNYDSSLICSYVVRAQSAFNNCNIFRRWLRRVCYKCTLSVCCDSYSDSCLVSRRYENIYIVVALCLLLVAVVLVVVSALNSEQNINKKHSLHLEREKKKLLLVS